MAVACCAWRPRDWKKNRAEARKDEIVFWLEGHDQRVAVLKRDVIQAFFGDFLVAEVHERIAAIDTQHPAFRADPVGQFYRRIAEAGVEGAVGLLDFKVREDGLAVVGQAID